MSKIVPENNIKKITSKNESITNNESTNNETEQTQQPKVEFSTVLKYVKHKFPSFMLFIHICVSKFVFVCDITYQSTVNSSSVTKHFSNENIESYYSTFWVYLITMSIVCLVWEILYKYCKQVKKKKRKITKSFIGYMILSSLISLMAFLSTIFYLDDNNVFDCFINYNEIFANLMFFMSYCIIIVVSTFENYCYRP